MITQASKEIITEEEAAVWWAGKELVRTKLLSDFIGKNEKTKLIVKLQKVKYFCIQCFYMFFS